MMKKRNVLLKKNSARITMFKTLAGIKSRSFWRRLHLGVIKTILTYNGMG